MTNVSSFNKALMGQISLNALYKGGEIFIGILLVPLSIKILGQENYGGWLTIYSIIAWFNFFDFGIGHGLRNYLSNCISENDIANGKKYIEVAYTTILITSIILLSIYFSLTFFIDWTELLNIKSISLPDLRLVISIVVVSFIINLILRLINPVLFAYLMPSVVGLIKFLSSILSLTLLYTLIFFEKDLLLYYSLAIVGSQTLVFFLFNVILFSSKFSLVSPKKLSVDKYIFKEIFGLGGRFFILQIAAVILYSTDNFIIARLFSQEDVTVYNISYKYFGLFTMGLSLILGPMWSAFTHAQNKGDFVWIKRTMNRSLLFISFLCLLVFSFYLIAKQVYGLWLGQSIEIPDQINKMMAIYVVSSMFLQLFTMFLNGVGRISLQLIVGVSVAIINIPLSIFLAKDLSMGISGVITATLICNIISLSIYPIQYIKLINNSAKGIWDK